MRDGRNVVAEGGVVYLVDEDTEEGSGVCVRIGLEFGVDLDDEGRGYGRKQTSLLHESARVCLNDALNIRILRCCPGHRHAS